MNMVARTVVTSRVALLAEGVDRNLVILNNEVAVFVALLAEGVDRNTQPSFV